jgi:demethylmenaquinone methyltransferase/2-methoxy-6-polyprenyl-1,4-benzoquinol methylase
VRHGHYITFFFNSIEAKSMMDQNNDNLHTWQVWEMFNRIAGRYDFLNRLLSFRSDIHWRQKMVDFMPEKKGLRILDLATGTADVLITLSALKDKVALGVGVDMARHMLDIGRQKIGRLKHAPFLQLLPADVAHLPFPEGQFDVATIAFGIRNFNSVDQTLGQIRRVLKDNGRLIVLEFSLPGKRALRFLYLLYFRKILPLIGHLISGDPGAYRYLNRSVESFPYGTAFCEILTKHHFQQVIFRPLTFGIATIYVGYKDTKCE